MVLKSCPTGKEGNRGEKEKWALLTECCSVSQLEGSHELREQPSDQMNEHKSGPFSCLDEAIPLHRQEGGLCGDDGPGEHPHKGHPHPELRALEVPSSKL